METTRRLQKIGGSVVLTIPAEIVRELSLKPEDEVRIRSEGGQIMVKPASAKPSRDVVEFMERFMGDYDEALRNLADR